MRPIDLSGQAHNGVLIVGPVSKIGKRNKYHCVCPCGNKFQALLSNVISGNTRSCGCLKKVYVSESHRAEGNRRRVNAWYLRHGRDSWFHKNYGFDSGHWQKIFDGQGCKCANIFCSSTWKDHPVTRYWQVDHDHSCCLGRRSCGKCVRGILCRKCNNILGMVNDSVEHLLGLQKYLQGAR